MRSVITPQTGNRSNKQSITSQDFFFFFFFCLVCPRVPRPSQLYFPRQKTRQLAPFSYYSLRWLQRSCCQPTQPSLYTTKNPIFSFFFVLPPPAVVVCTAWRTTTSFERRVQPHGQWSIQQLSLQIIHIQPITFGRYDDLIVPFYLYFFPSFFLFRR